MKTPPALPPSTGTMIGLPALAPDNPLGMHSPILEDVDNTADASIPAAAPPFCGPPEPGLSAVPDADRQRREHLAVGAMEANREARQAAAARGGPRENIEDLLDGTATAPPLLAGHALSPMTAGLRQVILRWSKLPRLREDLLDLIFVFRQPRESWVLLKPFDPVTCLWSDPRAAFLWEEAVQDLWAQIEDSDREAAAAWVNAEISRFFGSPAEAINPPGAPMSPPAERRAAAPAGGFSPSMTSPPNTPAVTSSAPSGAFPSTTTTPSSPEPWRPPGSSPKTITSL